MSFRSGRRILIVFSLTLVTAVCLAAMSASPATARPTSKTIVSHGHRGHGHQGAHLQQRNHNHHRKQLQGVPGTALLSSSPQALILSDSVVPDALSGSGKSVEQERAEADGFTVTVVNSATWNTMTAAQFRAYQVLIVGDPACNASVPGLSSDPYPYGIDASESVWAPVVMGSGGNRVVIGTDPTYHYFAGHPGGATLEQNGIGYAGAVAGATGMYVDVSCTYSNTATPTVPALLDGLTTQGPGHWSTLGAPCAGAISIVAQSGPTTGLHDTDLANWSCSVHEFFNPWPADYVPLAIATDPSVPQVYSATDVDTGASVSGSPYILVNISGVVIHSSISLSPALATNPVGGTHTVTATVLKNKVPESGKTVTFTVIGGPNAGKTGTGVTDVNGQATFTYTDTGGAGTDSIGASFTDDAGALEQATPVTKIWTSTPTPTTLTVKAGAGDFADPATVSAVLTNTSTSAPVSGQSVTLTLNGKETCTATTDGTGTASCTITPGEAAGTYTLAASFAGSSGLGGSTGSANFKVTLEQTALSYTGPTSATNGLPLTLSGVLTTDDPAAGTALAGKVVTFTLGTGGTAQTCTGPTNASGTASCPISSVAQTGSSVPVVASFAGDTFYLPATVSSSVSLPLGIQPTSLATTLSGGGQSGTSITVPEKTAVTDTATLSGANAASAGGTVTYNVYPDSDCDESPVTTSTVNVTAGTVPPSKVVTLSSSGTYNWTASYSGDANNMGSVSKCGSETEIVKGPESTEIKTKLLGTGKFDDGTLTVSSSTAVSDSATLSGDNVSSAGGTVTYTVYSDATCHDSSGSSNAHPAHHARHASDSSCKPTVVSSDTVTVVNGAVPNSSPITLSPGVYSWQASYSGDALNKASTSEHGSETEIVAAAKTMVSTSLSGSGHTGTSITVPIKTAVTDTATLSGADVATATGTVTYTVYPDSDCDASPVGASTVKVTAGNVPASTAVTLSKPGTYYWMVSYSGDTNNAPTKSKCGSETETVKGG